MVQGPLEVPKIVSRGVQSQNYFYNITKTNLSFYFHFRTSVRKFSRAHEVIFQQTEYRNIYENLACLLLSQASKRFIEI